MGHKTAVKLFRVGITEKSSANWFASDKDFASTLHQDIKIRKVVEKLAKPAGIDKVLISRSSSNVYVDLHVGRPGLAIGKGGAGIASLEEAIQKEIGVKVKITVHEVKQPYLSANLVAGAVVEAVQRGVPVKVAMRQQMDKIEASGAKGARIHLSGYGPVKQANTIKVEMRGGKVPLTTLRAKIDYGYSSVLKDRMYGIKVWIYKGEI